MQMREPIFDIDSFARRHIGPNEEEVRAMLRDVGFDSLGALIDATVPKDIRLGIAATEFAGSEIGRRSAG